MQNDLRFGFVEEIDPDNSQTWEGKVFLTLDIDWASEAEIEDTLNLLLYYQACATIHLTHHSAVLAQYYDHPLFRMGIHPNFEPLLDGDERYGDSPEKVFDYFLNLYPDAKVFRCHSLLYSSRLKGVAVQKGLRVDQNVFVPWWANIELVPWFEESGKIVVVPFSFADDAWLANKEENRFDLEKYIERVPLKVFNFHPVHIAHNFRSFEEYQDFKRKKIEGFFPSGRGGVRDILVEILERVGSVS